MTTEQMALVKAESSMAVSSGVQWTRDRVELVKRTICPKGISDDAFALFMEQCKRSGLDPLLKEAFCVPRNQRIGEDERGKPIYGTKHEFQPSEAGMLGRAERFPDFRGIQASAAYGEDDLLIDQGKGEVKHTFNPAKRKGALVGAWARVVREGKLPVVVWLDFSGYVQSTPLWSKIPVTMIEKCARVAALRKAYPEAFGGLYIGEEMPPEAAHDEPKAPRPAKVVEHHAPEPAPQDDAAIDAQFSAASAQVTGAPPPADTHVSFGSAKGKAIRDLSDPELTSMIDLGTEKLIEQPRAKWARAMRLNLAAMEAEWARRQAGASSEPTEEEKAAIRASEQEGQ